MKILIINGPNLNLVGIRETKIYGSQSFESYLPELVKEFGSDIVYFQSNIEGEIVSKIQEYGFDDACIILNAGAYTHTSYAIRDAIAAVSVPVAEVHISNTLSREDFRHKSVIGPVCVGCIMGFGLDSYRLALQYFTSI